MQTTDHYAFHYDISMVNIPFLVVVDMIRNATAILSHSNYGSRLWNFFSRMTFKASYCFRCTPRHLLWVTPGPVGIPAIAFTVFTVCAHFKVCICFMSKLCGCGEESQCYNDDCSCVKAACVFGCIGSAAVMLGAVSVRCFPHIY